MLKHNNGFVRSSVKYKVFYGILGAQMTTSRRRADDGRTTGMLSMVCVCSHHRWNKHREGDDIDNIYYYYFHDVKFIGRLTLEENPI